jgi:hypothetical protein
MEVVFYFCAVPPRFLQISKPCANACPNWANLPLTYRHQYIFFSLLQLLYGVQIIDPSNINSD